MGGNPGRVQPLPRRPASLLLAFAAGPVGLGGPGAVAAQDWTTRPEYQIDAPQGSTGEFGRASVLRVGRSGTRIVVWDAGAAHHDAVSGILVFSPDGDLLLQMEPDDFPGDPGTPVGVRAGASGFRVRYPDRSIRISYDGGNPGETVFFPRELGRVLPLAGGGFLGLSRRSAADSGGQAVVRLAAADGERTSDTIAVLDVRNSILTVALGDLQRGLTRAHESQPFADHDLTWMDAEAGSVGIVRRSGPPGVAEVFEIPASGDTAWHRRLRLPAVPVSADRVEREIAEKLDGLRAQAGSYGLTEAQLRTTVEEALHVPSHLPSVSAVVATASGEVWLRSREADDGMAVWYVIPRVDEASPARRVLLPASFRLNDAFGDHVWGFSEPSPEQGRILVGLRLVGPAAPPTSSGDHWTTEPEFEFGERVGESPDANFALVGTVRVLAGGNRLVVAEPRIFRATIWTPDGSLIAEVGRSGEGPGEFRGGFGIRVHSAGFHVRDAQRFTLFSNDGTRVGTVPFPPRSLSFRGFGLRPEVLLEDGSVLAIPRVPPAAMIGFGGDDPITGIPVFRLQEADRNWRMDRIAMLDLGNRQLTIVPEGRSMYQVDLPRFHGRLVFGVDGV